MPGMDGFEVCRRLKSGAKTRTIPVVMITARGSEVDVVRGLQLGADDYVVKPFSPKVLVARVRAVLRRDSAAAKVKDLVDEEGNPDLKLRVFVQGGGCSGFQYGFTFDEVVNEDDTQMNKNGVTLLIDAMSLQYLAGAEIDYKEDLQGAQFVIKNPNATTTCGCGSSFSV